MKTEHPQTLNILLPVHYCYYYLYITVYYFLSFKVGI